MKKYVINIFLIDFLFLVMFVFTNVVKADGELTCSNAITMFETTMSDPNKIEVKMPICGKMKFKGRVETNVGAGLGVPEGQTQDFGDVEWVKKIGDIKDRKMVNTEDNKGTIPVVVVLCGSKDTKIRAKVNCTYTDTNDNVITTYEQKKEYYRSEKRQKEYDDCIATYNACIKPNQDCKSAVATCKSNCRNNNALKQSSQSPIKPKINLGNELIEDPNVDQTKLVIKPICDCPDNCDTNYPTSNCSNTCAADYPEDSYKWVDDTTKPVYGCKDTGYTYNSTTKKCENKNAIYNYSTNDATDLPMDTKGFDAKIAEKECTDSGKADCKCNQKDVKYAHMCPKYECTKEDVDVKICTPTFKNSTGVPFYCVNPGQPFSPSFSTTASYTEDTSFSVNDCETSYSTVDCGYANILIEAAYANNEYGKTHSGQKLIEDKTIEFALRLWGVHTQQTGFDYVGVSNRTGDSCQTKTYYMKTSSGIVNPYVETYKEFSKVLLNSIRYRDDIDPAGDVSMFNLTCSKDLGIACGSDIRYKRALALLANTVIGNSKMKDHLKALFKEEITKEVSIAEIITTEDGKQYIQTTFPELIQVTRKSNVKIDCKNLNGMVTSGKITQQQKNQIEPFCKVSVALVDAFGRTISEYGSGNPDYCYKNYCRKEIKKFAICDIEEVERRPAGIKVSYTISKSSKSIKKYVSCSNPVNNQMLFGFDEDLLKDTVTGDPSLKEREIPFEKTFKILDFKCQGSCDDYEIRKNIKNSCDDNKKYYGSYDSTIKDPSLKCILNMGNPAIKSIYDYSEDFAAENRFCKVYCSDEVTFHIAEKAKETSGKVFYYDVENIQTKNLKYLFSNIIEEKRTCVSEIKYLNNKFTQNYDWAKIYGFGKDEYGRSDGITEEEINKIENWSTLFDVLVKKSRLEGGRTENINKILYDLLNCNLYTEEEIKAAGVIKPKNYKVSNIREKIKEIFSKNNKYGLGADSSCSMDGGSNPCFSMNNINYDFGGDPDGKSINMKYITKIDNKIDNLVYCSGATCFQYDSDHKDQEYNYPTGKTNKTTKKSLASLGNSGKVIGTGDITIPENDYVMFDVKATISFYNASRFEVKPSGKVITAGKEPGTNYMKLNTYSYPIDRFAYNSGVCSDRTFLINDGFKRCEIKQKYNNVETFFRKSPQDEFYNEVNLHKEFKCYVDIEIPSPECDPSKQICRIGTTFRNVDISNIFPSSKDGFTTRNNSNWGTTYGRQATTQILHSANTLNVTDDYLQYRIVLSPTQIKNIQNYNKTNNSSYIAEEAINCEIVNDTYRNCYSPFVEELRKNKDYGSLDEKYRGPN